MKTDTKRSLKRLTSMLLTLCMVVGLTAVSPGVTAWASTELQDESSSTAQLGISDATAYKWKGNGVFDFVGRRTGNTGYTTDPNYAIKCTFSFGGYKTYYQVGTAEKVQARPTMNGGVFSNNDGVEVKIKLSPSSDNKYILVDYYVYETQGQSKTVKLGSGADVMIDTQDNATIYKTTNGMHMVDTDTKSTFDFIAIDTRLGLTPPDKQWIGAFSGWDGHVFDQSTVSQFGGSDSAMTYSWTISLRPYETVHKRVAFIVKASSYYVSYTYGSDGNDGLNTSPLKTIEAARNKIGNGKGFIYIMDYPEISSPIAFSGSSQDITIASTDYDRNNNPQTELSGYIKPLIRSGTNSMFTVSGGARLKFTDITLDGGSSSGASPLIDVTNGTLNVISGATIKNAKGGDGSAIKVTGSASGLEINGGTITGNTSTGNGSVYYNGSESGFKVKNSVSITGNTASGDTAAPNIYLPTGKYITVAGDLGNSRIGVTTQNKPVSSPNGVSSTPDQEILIAKPGYATTGAPFADNFVTDTATDLHYYITAGTQSLQNANNAVLKRDGMTLSFQFLDSDTGGDVVGAPETTTGTFAPQYKAGGEAVTAVSAPLIPNYTFKEVQITPADHGLTVDPQTGSVSGSMPAKDVEVTFLYQKNQGIFKFVANGATPAPSDVSGAMGDAVNDRSLPQVTRFAYLFKGWSRDPDDDRANPQDTDDALPEYYPQGTITYYAMLTPDTSKTFPLNVLHKNKAGTVTFRTEPVFQTGTYVEARIEKQGISIPGYTLSVADSGTSPAEYVFTGDVPETLGTFNEAANKGTFKMPAQSLTANFVYVPDTGVKKTLKVEHYLRINGVTRDTPMRTDTSQLAAESEITAAPITGRGYEFKGITYTDAQGQTQSGGKLIPAVANLTANAVDGVPAWSTGIALAPTSGDLPDGTFTGVFAGDGTFTGTMPNQDVTIKYYYESTGEGYPYWVEHIDQDATDTALKNMQSAGLAGESSPIRQNMVADTSVTADPLSAYGYTLVTIGSNAPKADPATVTNEEGATVPTGSFNTAKQFEGTMPKRKLTVTYTYTRDSAYWKTLTYKNGYGGTITNTGTSSMLTGTPNNYTVSVLAKINENTGWQQSWTWADLKNKKLVPTAEAHTYYLFEGWFNDANNNRKRDNDEPLYTGAERFADNMILTASFVEDPTKWIDVTLKAGEHCTGAPVTVHIPYDKTWGDIGRVGTGSIPNYLADIEANYKPDDWYDVQTGTPVENTARLADGKVYEYRVYADPAVFGTDVVAPVASAEIGADGKGRITVPGTTTGYRYILADPDGNIVNVLQGNVSGRVYFEGLYPETRYTVYEALATVQAQVGSPISSVTGTMSDPTEVLVPVVETNYQILYDDENEGKTVLKISPADKASDYAILNEDGSLAAGWKTPTGSSPAAVAFSNLGYNENYVVVARPNGTATVESDRLDDGTPITTDPGGELEIPTYTVEAVNGQVISVAGQPVGADSYDEAESGDKVVLRADAQNAAGRSFNYWKILVGTVPGLSDTTTAREVSFTMPKTNVVMAACYEDAPDTLTITHEVRGGNRHEMALDPEAAETLKGAAPNGLKAGVDESLLTANGANVTYKVVYKKTAVKATESNAIKTGGGPNDAYSDHEDAYRCAWGLDVSVERYVNGRRVPPAATPSDADLDTIVQLDREDVDMKDYCLYEIHEDGSVSAVDLTGDPEESGGLFRFTAHAGSRYVLAYARAYWLTFYDNTALEKFKHPFKVYRGESPSEDPYADEDYYGKIRDLVLNEFTDPSNGYTYTPKGWSYSADSFSEFDDGKEITRRTNVYAFYENNGGEVLDARKEFEDEIKKALDKAADYFLKAAEAEEMKEFIREAQDVFNTNGATIEELIEALEVLKEKSKPFDRILETRYAHYNEMKGGNSGSGWGGGSSGGSGGSSGGSGGSGGSSGGSGGASGGGQGPVDRPAAYVIDESRSYEVGTNGQWMPLDEAAGQWAFILNGGTRLTSIWAKLDYANGDVNKNGWYHFNSSGLMDKGWVKDEQQNWYYCNTEKDGWLGKMRTGWYDDAIDKRRYYLDPETGRMATGWRKIDGKWYYFTMSNAGATYLFDSTTGEWAYVPGKEDPVGAMLTNTTTPDGYKVGPDGAWIE